MSSTTEIRQRKVAQSENDERTTTGRRKSYLSGINSLPQGLKVSFLCLIVCVILILFVLGVYMDSMSPIVERLVSKFGYERSQYAVIIDAGSTGSRVLAYKFHRSLLGNNNQSNGDLNSTDNDAEKPGKGFDVLENKLVLDEELFHERKPGLSSFAENPIKGAHTIKLLLDEARVFVPKEKWANTPLVLKATAGLRLLPPEKAKAILNAVRDLFKISGFYVDNHSVEIMSGTDEGIFSWFTVNLLLGRLQKANQAAALDLGGGSTQVTFSPADPRQVPIYEKYVHPVHTLNKDISVFTHSYLGLGLMAVRHAVFTKTASKDQTVLESECVNPITRNKTWIYSNIEYQISGKENSKSTTENPVVDFDVCLDSIKSIVIPLVKPKPLTLKNHMIAAFSYYFDRAIESGLVDPFAGGEITVDDYRSKAREVCGVANTEQPFMCFDLTFISVLLREGFGLSDKKRIKLYKRIDNHEISWALGCAYNVLTSNDKFNS